MGKRSRLHKQAVIAGTEKPYRAGTDKPPSTGFRVSMEKALELAGVPMRKREIIVVASPGGKVVTLTPEMAEALVRKSTEKPKESEQPELSASDKLVERVRKMKEARGG